MANSTQLQTVDLFYLGGLAAPGVNAFVVSGQKSYKLPDEVGGYIRVYRYVADDLMAKHNVFGTLHFTLDSRIAKQAKEGRLNKTAAQQTGQRPVSLADFSIEEIQAHLADRGGNLDRSENIVLEAPAIEAELQQNEPATAAPTRGRKKAADKESEE